MNKEYHSLADFAAWELEAYADGESLPHVAAFFAQQPTAWRQWLQEQRWTSTLRSTLYRFDCPTPATLLAYHQHALAATEQQPLVDHLRLCPLCTQELAQLQRFLPEAAAPATTVQPDWRQLLGQPLQALAERMELVVARLMPPTAPALAGAALRSAAMPTLPQNTPTTLLFEAGDTAISLMIQPESTQTLRLAGQLLTLAPTNQGIATLSAAPPADAVIQTAIDAMGNFVVETLAPGTYQLALILPAQAIVVPNLQLA
ncbi:MAG: hypothetical protein KF832_04870 [Caldilineaceae bacterium]|nr:hypothetical protein [Caldilineaceae bacterium]